MQKKDLARYIAEAMFPKDINPKVIEIETERLKEMKKIELEAMLWNAKKIHRQRQEDFGTVLI